MKHNAIMFVPVILFLGFASPERAIAGDRINITILYDNYVSNPATVADWGFSCFIEGLDKTILFDSGQRGDILSGNAGILLSSKLSDVNLVVLSHDHLDHTGGLSSALGSGSKASVYFGASFSAATEQMVRVTGATTVRSADPVKLLPSVQTTGEVPGVTHEQALIISTDSGLVVITGCSHPGVIQILERAKQLLNRNVYMVFGGFHWLDFPDSTVNLLVKRLKEMGVRKCGATHCTGERAVALIKQAYGSDFVDLGVGRVINLTWSAVGVKPENGAQSPIPQMCSLDQNYPNPFNPSTKIQFSIVDPRLPREAQHGGQGQLTIVKVFDVLGREISMLVNEVKQPGTYSVEFDASNVASGVYLYRLSVSPVASRDRVPREGNGQAGDFISTKKMLVLK